MDPYTLLGVARDATQAEIREAYTLATWAWHPDRFPEGPLRVQANSKMAEINSAYEILRDVSCRQGTQSQSTSNGEQQKSNPKSNTDEAIRQTDQGDAMYHQNRYAEAEPFYREAVRLDPKDVIYQYNLGMCLQNQERYSEAEPFLRQAANLRGKTAIVQYMLAKCLEAQEKYTEAEPFFRKAVDIEPENMEYQSGLGCSLYFQDKYAEAISVFQKIIILDANSASGNFLLGMSFLNLNQDLEAEKYFRKAVNIQPDKASYQYYLGISLYNQEKYADAEPFLREAARIEPQNARYQEMLDNLQTSRSAMQSTQPRTQKNSESAMGRTVENSVSDKPDQPAYKKTLRPDKKAKRKKNWNLSEKFPEYIGYFFGLILVLWGLHNPSVLHLLNNIVSKFTGTHNSRSLSSVEANKVAQDNAALAKTFYNSGMISFKAQQYANAEANFRKSVEVSPDNDLYQFALACAIYRQGKYAEAEPYHREAVRLKPNDAMYLNELANCLAAQQKNAEAEKISREVIKLDPNNADYQFVLSAELFNQEKYAESEPFIREAVRLAPNNAVWKADLVRLQKILGKQ